MQKCRWLLYPDHVLSQLQGIRPRGASENIGNCSVYWNNIWYSFVLFFFLSSYTIMVAEVVSPKLKSVSKECKSKKRQVSPTFEWMETTPSVSNKRVPSPDEEVNPIRLSKSVVEKKSLKITCPPSQKPFSAHLEDSVLSRSKICLSRARTN